MKKILLIGTGGTIASEMGESGLTPELTSQQLLRYIPDIEDICDVRCLQLFSLDSTNIQPKHWVRVADAIRERYGEYDGFVVSHGTDTMAYTASAVTFMLPNINLPVVFTGSQLPIGELLSDAPDNLRTAFAMAASGCPGVFLAFDRKVMLGCRGVKVRASGFSAFESINASYAARVTHEGLMVNRQALPANSGEPELKDQVSQDVFLLKLTPGLREELFDALGDMGYRGIVIEAFGLGGVNVLNRGLSGIRRAVKRGISVVVTTQCLYDSSDLRVYQVGNRLLELGVIQGRDMTSEAAMTKLMWALGQDMNPQEIKALFARNLAGEITPGAGD